MQKQYFYLRLVYRCRSIILDGRSYTCPELWSHIGEVVRVYRAGNELKIWTNDGDKFIGTATAIAEMETVPA